MTPISFVWVGVPMTRLAEKYDPSPETWIYGAVDRLLLISLALCYCGYTSVLNRIVNSVSASFGHISRPNSVNPGKILLVYGT